jgi:hypothetical protein
MARGQVVLFTGAGFSNGALDLAGRAIPQVDDLEAEMWALAYPDDDFPGEADLGDLYEVALRRSRRSLIALLRSRLDVDPESLPPHFGTWFSMPWRIVYTVNIDNLDEAAQRAFELPRPIKPVSALTGDLTVGGGTELVSVHVNGTRDEIPNATFGPLQYGARNALPEPLYGQLVTDILTFPVVFVGTELRESPLWTYIALRGPKGPRGVDERRPRSFVVSPSMPQERADLLEGFNIAWIPMSAEQFAEEMLSELTIAAGRGFQAIADRAHSMRQRVQLQPVLELAALPAEPVSEFLLGSRPTWGDITSGRAVRREFEDRVAIEELPACLVVTGTAGIGTSTTLMQIALRSALAGHNALWLVTRYCAAHEVSREIGQIKDDAIVFIDDADALGRGLESLIKDVGKLPNVRLVIGMRSGRLDDVLGGWRPESAGGVELDVPGLEDSDVDRLIVALDADNKLGQLKGLSIDSQRAFFVRESGRQLLVAMIKATSGEELQQKIVSEMGSLAPMPHMIYAVLAIASDFRSRLTRDEVLGGGDALSNEGVNALDRLVARRLVKDVGHESYELRHRLVAEIASAELRRSGRAYAPYLGLARVLAAKHRPGDRTSRIGRLLISLISHRRVNAYFDAHQARALYQELEDFLSDDYHFLLQRGSYELDFGNLSSATNYLQQARQLGAGDIRVETEWAHLLMRKACADARADGAAALVEEARLILLDQIDKFGASDRHSYHVYGSQVLAWTKRSSLSASDKRGELVRALQIVEAGARRHPGDRDLKTLAEGLKRELLMTAVA